MDGTPAVVLEHVTKRYGEGPQAVQAINDVSLSIRRGEFVSVMGPSGCGKSTLLNLIAGLDRPEEGRVLLAGQELSTLSDNTRCDLRLRYIGFVFQSFHLLPTFTVEENVAWPLRIQGFSTRQARERARATLRRTGISEIALNRVPAELAGGEQQRVAIARAIVTKPLLLLADEPTGNLDTATGIAILDLLRALNRTEGVTVTMVTHSLSAGAYGHRTIDFSDGRIVREYVGPSDSNLSVVRRDSQKS